MGELAPAPNIGLDKVEWRVDGKPTKGEDPRCRFVPYLDARDIAALLDQWVGPGNWRDEYQPAEMFGGDALWCTLSVRFGDEWISKRDVGVPSQFEPQKGGVSDAFKRVGCIKWGVGRNVYDLPTLWAPCRVDNREKAWPTKQSLPSIRTQLRDLGYDDVEGRIIVSDPTDDNEEPTPPRQSSRRSGQAKTPSANGTAAKPAGPPPGDVPHTDVLNAWLRLFERLPQVLPAERVTEFKQWGRAQGLQSKARTEGELDLLLDKARDMYRAEHPAHKWDADELKMVRDVLVALAEDDSAQREWGDFKAFVFDEFAELEPSTWTKDQYDKFLPWLMGPANGAQNAVA